MVDLKLVSDEELQKIIANAQTELVNRQDKNFKEKKAETIRAIEELIAAARALGKYSLGKLCIECEECDNNFYLDILYDDILEDIVKILGS